MTDIKETIKVQSEAAVIGLEQAGVSAKNKLWDMPPVKRYLILGLIIGFIPALLLVRYGSEQIMGLRYARQALSAHPSFNAAQNPTVGAVKIVSNPTGIYSAYVEVTNPNLDLAAPAITYSIAFSNGSGQTIFTSTGSFYLLPDEKKTLVIPRIEASEAITTGTIKLGEVKWQKKISLPEVALKVSEPILYEETNPLTFVAEGSVINNSPYALGTVRLVFVLHGANNQVVGVSQRDEFRLPAFGRRAYKQLWPGLYQADVRKVQVTAYTNTLDPQNITTETVTPTPSQDDRNNSNPDFF